MSFENTVIFEYNDYTGNLSDGTVQIHWIVTYANGKKVGAITYLVDSKPDTSFIEWIISRGAKYIPFDTLNGDPPIEKIWKTFSFLEAII